MPNRGVHYAEEDQAQEVCRPLIFTVCNSAVLIPV